MKENKFTPTTKALDRKIRSWRKETSKERGSFNLDLYERIKRVRRENLKTVL